MKEDQGLEEDKRGEEKRRDYSMLSAMSFVKNIEVHGF
jgi:hypothetical protein